MPLAITTITPAVGFTAGKDFITIEGTDFDQHPDPSTISGFIGDPGPSVKVKIGHLYAKEVNVRPKPGGAPGETIIECLTPRYVGDPQAIPATVDVVVENLLNPGTVTEVGGFKYRHQDVKPSTAPGVLFCVVKNLINELARQIPLKDVVDRTHTDYDENTGDSLNVVKAADTPALLVGGIDTSRSEMHKQYDQEVEVSPGEYKALAAPTVLDLVFTLTLIDEHKGRLYNLTNLLTNFVDENGRLGVELVQGDPSQGFTYFDLEWVETPNVDDRSGRNNLVTSVGRLAVLGVPVTRVEGVHIANTYNADEIVLGFEQKTA